MGEFGRAGRFLLFVAVVFGGCLALYMGNLPIGWGMVVSGGAGQVWTVFLSLWEQRNDEIHGRKELVRARMAFGIAASQWDMETRHFLAREWPEMGVEFGEEQIEYILKDGVNTGILIPFMRSFLQDSSEHVFVDVRSYNDDKRVQELFNCTRETVRTQHKLAREFLEDIGFLIEGSMAGSSSFKWKSTEHYHVMRRRYLSRAPLRVLS